MKTIRLYDHPFAPVAPKVFQADSLGEWLLQHYGPALGVNVQIFAGEPCAANEITGDVVAVLADASDEYVILQSPGSPVVFYVIMVIVAVAAIILMPKPVMPGNVNRTQQSPNNSLANRQNQVRMLERVEDIYGTVKAIPSLMMPTYNKYIDHNKYEYGYYCVGRGYYDIDEVRDGETLIGDITGASAAVYDPFTSPNSGDAPFLQIGDPIIDEVMTVTRAIEVDGITLKAYNQVQLPLVDAVYDFLADGKIRQIDKTPNFNSVVNVGDTVEVIASVGGGEPYDYAGEYEVLSVGDGFIITDGSWPINTDVDGSVQVIDPPPIVATDWVTLPDADRTQVWCNIVAPNGLYKDDGGKSLVTVSYSVEIEQLTSLLVPTGVVETVVGALAGAVADERADTVEHVTAWTGPARVRMARTADHDFDFEGTVVDEIKWGDLYSVSPVSKLEFGNKTTIHTITQATARATASRARELNCIASRRLPIFNGTVFSGAFDATGLHVSGTIAATSKLVDIIAAVSVDPKIGARDLATEVDMAQIWGVQQVLDAWNVDAGQFNYTLDSDNTSFEETVIMIANAGFCIAYRQNGKIRLSLDQAQAVSTALFTHRNKKPNSETITRRFSSDAEYDGVEFVYVDPDTQQSETITLPLDASYTKLKKFEIAGVRNFAQAWLRANREYFKIIGQRITIETSTTLDARALLPNARIDVVDNTRFKAYDGEVVGQAGLVLTLSQAVAFTPAEAHSIVLMRRDGSLQSIPVTAGDAPNKVVLQSLPSEAIVTAYGAAGVRTIFSFAADSARGAMAYLVQELDLSDGQYATIRAVNYSADYYQMDYEDIPDKSTVIN
jgi:hypothetical protein